MRLLRRLNSELNGWPTEEPTISPKEIRHRLLLRAISLLAVPTLMVFAVVRFALGDWSHGMLNLGIGVAVALVMLGLPRFGHRHLFLRLVTALIGVLVIYDMAKGGPHGEMIQWMYIWPLMVFFAHGGKEGLLWMIPMLLAVQVVLWLPPSVLDIHPYPYALKIRFLISYMIVTATAFLFEFTIQAYSANLLSERAKIADTNRILQEANDQLKREIRQRRKLERELERASKMEAVGALAGGVAHDLNNILSGLVSYPDLILMDLPRDSSLRQPIETMQASGKKAAAIVQDLLTLARRSTALPETVDLNQIITDYVKSPEYRALDRAHAQVRLKTDLATDLLPVNGSPVHLSKAVMNLVANAAEAMPSGGEIRIQTANRHIEQSTDPNESLPPGSYAAITVADTGMGISNDDRQKIFEPFYTRKKMGRSGTGLGLSIVWATVKDHKGFIYLESSERQGTKIHLLLPATRQAAPAEVHPTSHLDLNGRGESILVVDDMAAQREIVAALLKRLGYTVDTAASGEEAVIRVRSQSFDLLLIDMIMEPGMDGLETYRRVLEIRPRQPAIIASGYSKTERVRRALKLGANAYLRKPYTLEILGQAVKKTLANPSATPANEDGGHRD